MEVGKTSTHPPPKAQMFGWIKWNEQKIWLGFLNEKTNEIICKNIIVSEGMYVLVVSGNKKKKWKQENELICSISLTFLLASAHSSCIKWQYWIHSFIHLNSFWKEKQRIVKLNI